jgi:thiamine-phosphate pyrophosphorylase
MPREKLLAVLPAALRGGVDLVQVWAAWKKPDESYEIVKEIAQVTREHRLPLIINNDLSMAKRVNADGIHMDGFGHSPDAIRARLGESCIVGYTTGNDLSRVEWAQRECADYIYFCSIFPSKSVTDCEIVPLEAVRKARALVEMPIFASGGITLENTRQVLDAGADGIAVVSALQYSADPETTASQFKRIIISAERDKKPR